MRKLTTLATTAIAALALIAVMAMPASADLAFQVNDPYGNPCDPYCEDTGYEGTFYLGNASLASCTASFDIRIESDGAFETYNTDVDCDAPSFSNIAWECDDSWTGQIRLPDTGPSQIDLDACLTYYPHNSSYDHQITVEVRNNPRRWLQLGTGTTTGPAPINNAYFGDLASWDNVTAILL